MAAQTVLPDSDLSIGIAFLGFVSFFGGSVFITVAQTLLQNKLVQRLEGVVPSLSPSALAHGGAASLRHMVPAEKLSLVLDIYNDSIRSIWYLGLGLSCWIFLASLGMEWRTVKKTTRRQTM